MPELRILYIGDIMGRPGREVVARLLLRLRREYAADLVIAQSENVTHGAGMSAAHMRGLQQAGVDFFTGGNHSLQRRSLWPLLVDPDEPVIAPLNQPGVEPGWGAKVVRLAQGRVLIASLLGATFPPPQQQPRNPLQAVDGLLDSVKGQSFAAVIVNFHGDFSSEKRVIGYYLDGRVSAVIGDHWHVPTADAMILPNGTAHISDVGMCGTLHSSLGIAKDIIIARWRDGLGGKNEMAEGGPLQLNAVLVTVDSQSGLAIAVRQIQEVL